MRPRLFVLFVFISTAVLSQSPHFKSIPFDNFHINRIYTITADTNGMIWLAADIGIMNYDGIKFRVAVENKLKQLSSLTITNQNIMIAGYQSGEAFMYKTSYSKVVCIDSIRLKYPVKKALICDGITIVATYGGGCFFKQNNKWKPLNTETGLVDDYVNDMVVFDNSLFIATDNGMSKISCKNFPAIIKNYTPGDESNNANISNLALINNSNIYALTKQNGLYLYNPATDKLQHDSITQNWTYGEVKCAHADNDELWIGTSGNVVVDIDWREKTSLRLFDYNSGFTYTDLQAIYRDRNSGFWVATNNNLLYSIGERMEILRNIGDVNIGEVNAIEIDANGGRYFANKKGVFCLPDNTAGSKLEKITLPSPYQNESVMCMYLDAKNYLWMGTFNNVLLRYNTGKKTFETFTEKNGLTNASAICITGNDSTIWLATLGGLYTCDINNKQINFVHQPKQSELAGTYIYKILLEKNGTIWYATDGNGLIKENNGNYIRYGEDILPQLKIIYSMAKDNMGNLWCGTAKGGLLKFDGKNFTPVNYPLLNNHSVYTVTTDRYNHIIVTTDDAIITIDARDNTIIAFTGEQGLFELKPNPNVVAKTRHDEMYFGVYSGIVNINPRFFKKEKTPQLVMHNILLFSQPVNAEKAIFDYNKNYIGFEFAALNYDDPKSILYQYRLKGYNKEWRETGDNNVSFPNLPPGNYEFQLRASSQTIFNNKNKLSVRFKIKQPFYATSFFIIGAITTLLVLAFFIVRLRIKNIRKMEALKKDKLLFELEGLKMQVNPHFLHNSFNTLINIIETDTHAAVTYVEKLSDFFRNILMLQTKDLVTLKEELLLARDYFYLQQQRFGNAISLSINIGPQAESKMIPPLTLQMLLENIFKHNTISNRSKITIEISEKNGDALEIKNTRIAKLNIENSTGIGLKNIESRYNIFTQRKLEIIATDTEFKVIVPLL